MNNKAKEATDVDVATASKVDADDVDSDDDKYTPCISGWGSSNVPARVAFIANEMAQEMTSNMMYSWGFGFKLADGKA